MLRCLLILYMDKIHLLRSSILGDVLVLYTEAPKDRKHLDTDHEHIRNSSHEPHYPPNFRKV